MTNKKKTVVVAIMGRLVKKTPSRHYWLYDGTKWVRLGLTRIADLLKVSADIIKAAFYTATKKPSKTKVKKAIEGLKYWANNVADKADVAFLVFLVIMGAALVAVAYSTHDVVLIALCAGFDILMAVYVGLLMFDGYKAAVKFKGGY